jgi:hypothetical protein
LLHCFRKERLDQLRAQQAQQTAGGLKEITIDNFVQEVTKGSSNRTVVLYLYKEKMVLPPSLLVYRCAVHVVKLAHEQQQSISQMVVFLHLPGLYIPTWGVSCNTCTSFDDYLHYSMFVLTHFSPILAQTVVAECAMAVFQPFVFEQIQFMVAPCQIRMLLKRLDFASAGSTGS